MTTTNDLRAYASDRIIPALAVHRMPGLGLAVTRYGETLLAAGYGLWDVEAGIPATAESSYSLASVTKGVTGAAIALLAAEGRVDLGASITAYLDGAPDTWRDVRLRHLLAHTSGITCYLNDFDEDHPRFVRDTTPDTTAEQIIARISDLPLKFAPGSRFAYGNTGNVLLGQIISAVSGVDWPAFFHQRLFAPLGMNSTRVILDMESALQAKVTGYEWRDGGFHRCLSWNPAWANAAGGVVTTPADMARWTAAFNDCRLLPDAARDAMWSSTRLNDGEKLNVGFGWNVDEDDGGHRRHTGYGGGPGISSHICAYVDAELSVAVFSNIGDVQGPLAELARTIARHLLTR